MKRIKFRKGQMAIVMTLSIATLLGVMALGADVGVMYFQWNQLQKGADAAALAGGNYLVAPSSGGYTLASTNVDPNCATQPDDPKKAACTYAINNGLAFDTASLTLNEPNGGVPGPNIQVIATRSNLPYMFGRVIGLDKYAVVARATAYQGATSAANGLFPMAVQCNKPCKKINLQPTAPVSFNQKFSPTGNASGNWQWLSNDGTHGNGAPGVGNAVANGMPGSFSIGQSITSETGNFSGGAQPVSNPFTARMNSCPAIGDPCAAGSNVVIPKNDRCLVTVPAVDFNGCSGSCGLAILAFAQVYIEPYSTSGNITACFINQVDPNAVASGTGAPALGSVGPSTLVQ